MPKSKRQKVVHLTKVQKKDKESKQVLFSSVREAVDTYAYAYILSVAHMRNTFLKDVRSQLSDSRMIFGKTKVMARALGMTPEEEYSPGLAKLADQVDGNVGLLFSDQSPEEIASFFGGYSEMDFARAGVQATREVVVPAGVVMSRVGEVPREEDAPVPHSVEPTLRKWGMPTRLDKGKVMLNEDWTLCREGDTLNSNQTALLKMFGIATVEFRIHVKAYWSKEGQDVKVLEQDEDEAMEES